MKFRIALFALLAFGLSANAALKTNLVFTGTAAGDGTGTPARTAFQYINTNLTDLDARLADAALSNQLAPAWKVDSTNSTYSPALSNTLANGWKVDSTNSTYSPALSNTLANGWKVDATNAALGVPVGSLPSAASLLAGDDFIIASGGVNKKVPANQLLVNSAAIAAYGTAERLDPDADAWLGVWFQKNNEQMYVTAGSLAGQRNIAGPFTSPASTSFRDGSPYYTNGTYYVAHTMNSFSETNAFAIISSRSLVSWQTHFIYDCRAASNYFGGSIIKQVWGPKWFSDDDGTVYITVALSTNTTSSGMRAFLTRATDATLTNWTDLVMLTNSLVIDNFDGFLIRSNTSYQMWTRHAGVDYIEVHTAQNLYGPWSSLKTGNWAGWGNGYEGMWVYKNGSRWFVILSDAAAGTQSSAYSDDDSLTWSLPVARVDSLSYMNGGMVNVRNRNPRGTDVYFYPNGSNATSGVSWQMGATIGTLPSGAFTLNIKGGTSALLALDGSTDSLIITDPKSTSRPWYLSRHVADDAILIYNNGVNNDLRFDGGISATNFSGNGISLTNLQFKISGTNATPPADIVNIKAWINVTLPDGSIYKAPIYQ